jgi:hypothetical protein
MMHPAHWDKCVEAYYKFVDTPGVEVENVRVLNWGSDTDQSASSYTPEQLAWFDNNPRQDKMNTSQVYSKKLNPGIGADFQLDTGEFERKHTVDYINRGMTNFKGYKCEIGLKSLFISWDGRIRRGNCSEGGHIGSIDDPDNIQWPDEPVTCSLNICHCTTDVEINKWI